MEAYRLALFAADLGWHDVTKLAGDRRKLDLAGQLYRALGSIEANIPEGYSRGSGRDRARFYGLRDRDQVEAPRVVGRGGISEVRGARGVKHPVRHYWGPGAGYRRCGGVGACPDTVDVAGAAGERQSEAAAGDAGGVVDVAEGCRV